MSANKRKFLCRPEKTPTRRNL